MQRADWPVCRPKEGDRLLSRRGGEFKDVDEGPLGCEAERDGLPDPGSSPGDEGEAVCEAWCNGLVHGMLGVVSDPVNPFGIGIEQFGGILRGKR